MSRRSRVALLITAAALGGCSSMTSVKIENEQVSLSKSSSSSTPIVEVSGLRYALPRGRLTIQVTAGYTYYAAMKKMKGKLELSHLAPVIAGVVDDPDPFAQYFLKLNPSAFSDDDFCINVNENGLLSSVGVVTADRSADIIKKVAEIAATIAGGPPVPAGIGPSAVDSPRRKGVVVWDPTPFFEITLDPYSALEIASAQSEIAKALRERSREAANDPSAVLAATREKIVAKNLDYGVEPALNARVASVLATPSTGGNSIGESGSTEAPTLIAIFPQTSQGQSKTPSKGEGIFYRIRRESAFTVGPSPGLQGREQQAVASMPDTASTSRIEISRSPMIRKETSLALTNGVLTSVHINKPSEALAVASLPLDVAGAIIETPARFFSSIAAATRSDTALLSAKAELLEAEIEFRKAEMGEEAKLPTGALFPATSTAIAAPSRPPSAFSSGLTCSPG